MMIDRIRTGTFCLHQNKILAIELEDPATKKRFWSFPGGQIESGETPEKAAIRETLEETGYEITLTSDGFITEYPFNWNGERYHCTTHWFMAKLVDETPALVDDADYLLHANWLPWPRSRGLFEFNPALTDAINHFLPATLSVKT